MRTKATRLPLLSLLALAGCASLQVDTVSDPAASFEGYRTFALLDGGATAVGPAGIEHPMAERELQDEVRTELLSKGYREEGEPDFRVAVHAAVDQRLDVDTFMSYYGYRRRGVWVEDQEIREFSEGTLVIDIVDAESNELAWRGTARAEVSNLRDATRRRDTIRTAVRQILSRFPPGG